LCKKKLRGREKETYPSVRWIRRTEKKKGKKEEGRTAGRVVSSSRRFIKGESPREKKSAKNQNWNVFSSVETIGFVGTGGGEGEGKK